MLSIATIGVRVFALLFGAVVLGLSVTLAKQQREGSPPTETSFGSFTGAFGIIASAIGLLALWVDKISPLVTMIIDALASIFYLAGGIALVLALKSVTSCTSKDISGELTRFANKILNGGCIKNDDGEPYCYVGDRSDSDNVHYPDLVGRCQRAQADYVFEFLGFVVGLALVALGFLAWRRGGTRGSRTYV
ncbi:hypothetical protein E8E14_004303 [Neopestalotiopsis sp. 37M]|nr:hypothetical protein E8E14_004303 [Neopestalotiopsis sp. 37M]